VLRCTTYSTTGEYIIPWKEKNKNKNIYKLDENKMAVNKTIPIGNQEDAKNPSKISPELLWSILIDRLVCYFFEDTFGISLYTPHKLYHVF
jgi:hypothetical protein